MEKIVFFSNFYIVKAFVKPGNKTIDEKNDFVFAT